jgi:predicted PolB exonuclease-like 3'-5' exonuclease
MQSFKPSTPSFDNKLLIFDIETIPDVEQAPSICPLLVKGNSNKELKSALTECFATTFLPNFLHRIVAIGILLVSPSSSRGFEIEQLHTNVNVDEKALLSWFLKDLVAESKPIFVTYNGRNFDVPVVNLRAMKHDISAACLYENFSKWEGYLAANSEWHKDLMHWYSGPSRRNIGLDNIASFLQLPTKLEGVSGKEVEDLFYDCEYDTISRYCERDVIITYLLFLYEQYTRGKITLLQRKESIKNLLQHTEDQELGEELEVLLEKQP